MFFWIRKPNAIGIALVVTTALLTSSAVAKDSKHSNYSDYSIQSKHARSKHAKHSRHANHSNHSQWLPVDPLGKQWWQHYVSIPTSVREELGETKEACGLGQRGNVWFLETFATEPATRECVIPRGRKLFVPLVTSICTPFPGETLEDNIQICREAIDPFDVLTLTIDSKDRGDLIERRAQSKGFSAWFPEENIYDAPGGEEDIPEGVYVSVSEGQYALIEGLSPGLHTIRAIARSSSDASVPEFDITYEINIVSPTTIVPR